MSFKDIIGQERVKTLLKNSIIAAKKQQRAIPHGLFTSRPGYGKSSLVRACADEMQVDIQEINGGNIDEVKKLLPLLAKIKPQSILLIDEIHQTPKVVQEALLPIAQDGFFTFVKSEMQTLRLDLPSFSLMGATTTGKIIKPLYDRFVLKFNLDDYSLEELTKIALLHGGRLGVKFNKEALASLVRRCRDTPRVLVNLLTLLRDYQLAHDLDEIGLDDLNECMKLAEIDKEGLTKQDREYMKILNKAMAPVGLKSLTAMLGISEAEIEGFIEPWLLSKGLIMKTSRGRLSLQPNTEVEGPPGLFD